MSLWGDTLLLIQYMTRQNKLFVTVVIPLLAFITSHLVWLSFYLLLSVQSFTVYTVSTNHFTNNIMEVSKESWNYSAILICALLCIILVDVCNIFGRYILYSQYAQKSCVSKVSKTTDIMNINYAKLFDGNTISAKYAFIKSYAIVFFVSKSKWKTFWYYLPIHERFYSWNIKYTRR